ncbi:MAG: DUF1467 family protein [Pseudomonadota bacterium]
MTITGAIVLFAVIWFMALLIALPLGLVTHGDLDQDGTRTPASSPANLRLGRKLAWVTAITVLLWAPLCGVIASGWIAVSDFDMRGILTE